MSKAKFDRTKPHVNIGTIGRVAVVSLFAAFLCASPRRVSASSDGWTQKLSDDFGKLLGRVKKRNLHPMPSIAFAIKKIQALSFRTSIFSSKEAKALHWKNHGEFKSLGSIYLGDLSGAMAQMDAPYQAALDESQSQAYRQLPLDILRPLDERWAIAETTHDRLAEQASDLDSQDASLTKEQQDLNQERSTLDSRNAQLNNEINAWNGECTTGQPISQEQYQQCVDRRNDLEAQKSQLASDIEQYNSRGDADMAQSNTLKNAARDWVAQLESWLGDVDKWVSDVKAALAAPDAGECTDELQNSVHEICDVDRRCKSDQACDELKANLEKNLACYNVRKKVLDVCPPSPKNHQGQLQEVQNAIDRCNKWISRCDAGAAISTVEQDKNARR